MKIKVSILVLLDVHKERVTNWKLQRCASKFQSLFYWMYIKNWRTRRTMTRNTTVSILVLLDVHKEPPFSFIFGFSKITFQSLFYWMYIKNLWNLMKVIPTTKVSILVLLDVHKEPGLQVNLITILFCFNPCFIGCT